MFEQLSSEIWLAKRLKDQGGPDVFDGTTDRVTRAQRFRAAIAERGLECVVVGKKGTKAVLWPEAIDALYGELNAQHG